MIRTDVCKYQRTDVHQEVFVSLYAWGYREDSSLLLGGTYYGQGVDP